MNLKEEPIDWALPQSKELLRLVNELSDFCKINNLPKGMIISGVAWDAETIERNAREKGYAEGKAYERGRIAELLGVSK